MDSRLRRPDAAAEGVADLASGHGGHESADQEEDWEPREVACDEEEASCEEKRVTGEEEADQEPRFGEGDEEQAKGAERLQELSRVHPNEP